MENLWFVFSPWPSLKQTQGKCSIQRNDQVASWLTKDQHEFRSTYTCTTQPFAFKRLNLNSNNVASDIGDFVYFIFLWPIQSHSMMTWFSNTFLNTFDFRWLITNDFLRKHHPPRKCQDKCDCQIVTNWPSCYNNIIKRSEYKLPSHSIEL